MRSILRVFFFFSFCILIAGGILMVYFEGKPEEPVSLDMLVKSPIITVNGENCSFFEDDIFTLEGKNSFGECEIRKNPNLFNGKLVRIKSNYRFMLHGLFLSDKEECVGLSRSIDEAISVGFRSTKDYAYIKKLNENPVSITAVGNFSISVPSHYSDTIYDRTPYYFEIIWLERAEKSSR